MKGSALAQLTSNSEYNLEEFDYELPTELIAQEPLHKRDQSRLLVYHRESGISEHRFFYELPEILKQDDFLVFNNTRVIPARLEGKRKNTGGKMEVLLLRRADGPNTWEAMVKPARKAPPGEVIVFDREITGKVESSSEHSGHKIISFDTSSSLEEVLPDIGKTPLPPYIKKEIDHPEKYQTVYSQVEGSVAAPTAGFHFTFELMEQLKEKGIDWTFITLHVGPGTFQQVNTTDIREHVMHSEYYNITAESAQKINQALNNRRRVIAVGTTSCRVLESTVDAEGLVSAGKGWTDLFIYPGFPFRAIDGLLTNFHLPRTSLFMLVCALAGKDETMGLYNEAIQKRYRFYSFGDAMLIL